MANSLSSQKQENPPTLSGEESSDTSIININQLRAGVYVELDLGWMDHPFFFRNFLIKNPQQIQALKKLGLTHVRYNPEKSTKEPLKPEAASAEELPQMEATDLNEMWEKKKDHIEQMKRHRKQMKACDKKFEESVEFIKSAMKNIRTYPEKTVKTGEGVIGEMVGALFDDTDVALHLVNTHGSGMGDSTHFINVTVLSLMLGKTLGLDKTEMHLLGIGSMFHDIGKLMIPDKVLWKNGPLNQAEKKFFQMHPIYGAKIAKETGVLPREAIHIIQQHHEAVNGQGYPQGLKGDAIHKLAKIVAITDAYDLYCNSNNSGKSLSPFEAISLMFAREKDKYDEEILGAFISSLGVYPPGTVVELTDEKIGLVVSVNSDDLLKPNIMIYNNSIPQHEAAILDLREEQELSIIKSVRPSTLPRAVHDYLGLEMSVNHYFSTSVA